MAAGPCRKQGEHRPSSICEDLKEKYPLSFYLTPTDNLSKTQVYEDGKGMVLTRVSMRVLPWEGEDSGWKQESSLELKSTRNGKDTANTSDFPSENGLVSTKTIAINRIKSKR